MPKISIQRAVSSALLAALLVTQTLTFDFTRGAELITRYGLVAILVDENTYNNTGAYGGLRTKYNSDLSEETLPDRIDRYALDVQASLENTKALIIKTRSVESPVAISQALEKLYFDGTGEKDEITELTGIVLIGSVPIPVVNKNGNSYPSLFPYTDFKDKIFPYDAESDTFLYQSGISEPQPEVWHGVIRPPVSGEEGNKLLAEYFDKNHLFRIGHPDFATFDEKIFYNDVGAEFRGANREAYGDYDRYLRNWEDISYLRYTKDFLKKLYKEAESGFGDLLTVSPEDQAELEKVRSEMAEEFGSAPAELNMNSDTLFDDMPDIQSKKTADKYLRRYYELFRKYLSTVNDFVSETGRYSAAEEDATGKVTSDVDTFVSLISKKDEYTRQYLREVNDRAEYEIDEIAQEMARTIPVVESAYLSGTYIDSAGLSYELSGIRFINHGIEINDQDSPSKDDHYINGIVPGAINSVSDCLIRRGSTQTVEALKTDSFDSESLAQADQSSKDPDAFLDQWNDSGGCTMMNYDFSQACFPERATSAIFDIRGARRDSANPHASPSSAFTDFRGCFDVKEREAVVTHLRYHDDSDYSCSDTDNIFGVDRYLKCSLKKYDLRTEYTVPYYPYPASFDEYNLLGSFSVVDFLNAAGKKVEGSDAAGFWLGLFALNGQKITVESPSGTSAQFLSVNVSVSAPKEISSVYAHKEPLNETINAQLAAGYSRDLPIDDPRYTTFLDAKNSLARIDYPNIFDAVTLADFENMLKTAEKKIAELPGGSAAIGRLSALVNASGGLDSAKITDALLWRSLNIDDKHDYVLRYYLNPELEPYAVKQKNGYEVMYFVADDAVNNSLDNALPESSGASESVSALTMQFNADIPGEVREDESDLAYNNREESGNVTSTSTSTSASGSSTSGSNDGGKDAVDIISWFGAITSWLGSFDTGVTSGPANSDSMFETPFGSGTSGSDGSDENSDSRSSSNDSDFDGISNDHDADPDDNDVNSNDVPDGAEATTALSFSAPSTALFADGTDSLEISVSALDSSGNSVETDSFTLVELQALDGSDMVKIASANPTIFAKGKASFTILSQEKEGTAQLRFKSVNRSRNFTSESFTVTTTKKQVLLSVYTEEYEDAGDAYEILNESDETIAEVNISDGDISVKNEAYAVTAQPATAGFPTRYEIADADGSVLGTLVRVPDTAKVTIADEAEFTKAISNGGGVFIAKKNAFLNVMPSQTYDGSYELSLDSELIGLVTPDGEIFLQDRLQYSLSYRITDGALIYSVTTSEGNEVIADILIGGQSPVMVVSEVLSLREGTARTERKRSASSLQSFEMLRSTVAKATSLKAQRGIASFELILKEILRYAQDDSTEKAFASASTITDSDGDGLSDLSELTIGTKSTDSDTDGDGFSDFEEIFSGYSPQKKSAKLFSDLSQNHPYFSAIIELYLRGILQGYSDGTFKPDQKVTREEFMKMDLSSICLNCADFTDEKKKDLESSYFQNPFPDTDINPALQYCVYEGKTDGIIAGYQGGQYAGYFKPKNTISRAEAMKVLLETSDLAPKNPSAPAGKPWYYLYIVEGQKNHIFPKNQFSELDGDSSAFQKWFDKQISENGKFMTWLAESVSRAEFADMAVNTLAIKDCFAMNSDSDGISDASGVSRTSGGSKVMREEEDSTPNEIASSLDSREDARSSVRARNDSSDPFGIYGKPGLYLIADNVETGLGKPSLNFDQKLSLDDIHDAEAVKNVYLKAEIVDENGQTVSSDNSSVVVFTVSGDSLQTCSSKQICESATLIEKEVTVSKGFAASQIAIGTKSGKLSFSSWLKASDIPIKDANLEILPGEPYSIELVPGSYALPSGASASTVISGKIVDMWGNPVYANYYEVTLTAQGQGSLDANLDPDPEQAGLQVRTYDGTFSVNFISGENQGDALVTAFLNDIEKSVTIRIMSGMTLAVSSDTPSLAVGSSDSARISAVVLDSYGQPVTDYHETAEFLSLDPLLGTLSNSGNTRFNNAGAETFFTPSAQAGQAVVSVSASGFSAKTLTLSVLAGSPVSISLLSDSNTLRADSNDTATVTARLSDIFGNLVNTDSTTPITFRITEDTQDFGTIISGASSTVKNGETSAVIRGTSLTGPIHVVAESSGLTDGTFELSTTKLFDYTTVQETQPSALYVSLLGKDAGHIEAKNYLGGWFLFSGKVEAVTTLLAPVDGFASKANIESSGKIEIASSTIVPSVIASSENIPLRVLLKNLMTDSGMAEIFYKLSVGAISVFDAPSDYQSLPAGISIIKSFDPETDSAELESTRILTRLSVQGTEVLRVYPDGRIEPLSSNISLSLNPDAPYFALDVTFGTKLFLTIVFKDVFFSDVTLLSDTFDLSTFSALPAGIYVKPILSATDIGFESKYSGNSLQTPKGLRMTDVTTPMSADSLPGFYYQSLEDSPDKAGIGFVGDNKYILLFSAGETVGEANLHYASDIGINLGDPTVSLRTPNSISRSGYTEDVGRMILSGDTIIREIAPIDFNNDELQDLILMYDGDSGSSRVKLLENYESRPRFADQGDLLNVTNGIDVMKTADVDQDGDSDLVIATREPCKVGETCVYVYKNSEGNFEREHLGLDIGPDLRVLDMEIADLNNDKYPDLLLVDSSGDLLAYYNKKGVIQTNGQRIDNLGSKMNGEEQAADDVLVSFSGMPAPENEEEYVNLSLPIGSENSLTSEESNALSSIVSKSGIAVSMASESASRREEKFLTATSLSALSGSTKTSVDVNGGVIEKGDIIQYTLVISNSGASVLKDVLVSDEIPDQIRNDSISAENFKCLDCDDAISVLETGQSLHPYVISGLSIPAKGDIQIQYTGEVTKTSSVDISVGHNMDENYPSDTYLDILARPEDNPDLILTYYYSSGTKSEDGVTKIQYKRYRTEPPHDEYQNPYEQFSSADLATLDSNGYPVAVKKSYDEQIAKDENKNGLSDEWDESDDDQIPLFTCEGGCIPLPINFAFLAMGPINVMGVSGGLDPGLPILAVPVVTSPPLPPIWPPTPAWQTSPFRLYLSPTLTGGLGIAACFGPWGGAACFVTAAPIQQLLGLCNAITGTLSGILAGAGSLASSVGSGSSVFTSSGGEGASSSNVVVAGIPPSITDWLARQTQEIITKLTDWPHLFISFPDLGFGDSDSTEKVDEIAEVDWSPTNLITFLNSLPLVKIEVQDVLFKIPWFPTNHADNVLAEWKEFLDQLTTLETYYKGAGISFSAGELIASVRRNIEALQAYKELPYQLLAYRNLEAKYIYQIVSILDAISDLLGGWLVKNIRIYYSWLTAIDEFIKAIETWKFLLDFQIAFMDSCDKCTSDRWTLLELIFKLLVVIPAPPVIPFPKWPDIVMDFSDIQAGIAFTIPNLRIKTEPIILPRPPSLPSLAPNISLTLPGIPIILPPPDLPDFPDLPSIPLFSLPDLPPPPKLPALPGSLTATTDILKKIMKILCMLLDGILPVPESVLKTEIEKITERGLTPLLSVDTMFSFQWPTIPLNFVDTIKVASHVNFQMDTGFVMDIVADVARTFNTRGTDLSDIWNLVIKVLENMTDIPSDTIDPEVDVDLLTRYGLSDEGVHALRHYPVLATALLKLDRTIADFEKSAAVHESENAAYPDSYRLIATQETLDPYDPYFNRSLADIRENLSVDRTVAMSGTYLQILSAKKDLLAYFENKEALNAKLAGAASADIVRLIAEESGTGISSPFALASASQDTWGFASTTAEQLVETLTEGGKSFQNEVQGKIAAALPTAEELETAGKVLHERHEGTRDEIASSPRAPRNDNGGTRDEQTSRVAMSEILRSAQDDSGAQDDSEEIASSATSSAMPKGLFLYNKEQEINERLISAVGDLGEPNHIAFGDFDNDSDEDIAYSFGGDLYFKENFTKNPKRHFVTDDPDVVSLDSLLPAAQAVNGFSALSVNNRLASLQWSADDVSDILGYEIISKPSVDAFDRSSLTATHRVHLIPDDSANPETMSFTSGVQFEVLSGEVELASGQIPADEGDSGAMGTLAPGEGIATGNNSEAKLTFDDGSTIMMDEKTFLFAPDITRDTVISVVQGEAQIVAAPADSVANDVLGANALLRPGAIIKVGDAEVSVTMPDGTVIDLPSFIEFTVPDFQKIKATVSEVEGAVTINTAPRVLFEKGDEFALDNALLVHTRRETRLIFRYGEGEYSFLLPQDAVFSLSRFAPGTTIKVKKGSLETIRLGAASELQQAEDGMLILPSDTLSTGSSGSAIIRYSDAVQYPLGKYETFILDTLSSPADPSYELRMENGNYISKIFTLLSSGKRSTESASILLAPQVCADHSPPSANAGKSEQQVLLYQTLTLSASSSFDTHSNITNYSWDITPEDDSDSVNDTHDTTLTLGPFTQASSSAVKLTVEDERGNTASSDITIGVTVPQIFLDPSSRRSGVIEGYIDSKIANIPINILRQRGGVWEFLETPRAPDGIILTDEEGKFIISDANLSSNLSVLSADQTTVAEISPVSGRIQPSEDGYTVSVKSSEVGEPTRLELQHSQGSVFATVFFVPDSNADVVIEPSDFTFTKESVATFSGVHVRELARGVFTSGLQTKRTASAFRINSDGSISLFQDSLSLKLAKSADLDDPAVIQIVSGETPIAEVYIATPPQGQYSFLTEEDARNSATLYTLEEGLYVSAPSCDLCPCQTKIVDFADLIPGDVIFTAIMDPERNEIYAKSEEVEYVGK